MVAITHEVGFTSLVARFGGWPRELVRFAAVGVVNTGLFLLLYLAFRIALPATAASLLATGVTAVTGTVANGRVTFGVKGAIDLARHLKSLVVTGLGLVVTTGAVSLVDTGGNAVDEVVVLVVASAVAGVVRFVLMGRWVFRTAG
ncbi:GtrA family protein [Umezawaea sp. Da 62-37]|uniref:GtrA family protein n=1 Tax=Umezawaea sp. Da 62-37 TaxID=3075927 RepID=UPI0028F72911|nr:GtrA family protein [Umezawaea sp. Da 62-37]WNV85969.1 GtrA family protein [Umezawaea sp. Da 62-37]